MTITALQRKAKVLIVAIVFNFSSSFQHLTVSNRIIPANKSTPTTNYIKLRPLPFFAYQHQSLKSRNQRYENDDYDDDDYDDEDYYYEEQRKRRNPRKRLRDDLSSSNESSFNLPSPFGNSQSTLRLPASVSSAVLAGVFVVGLGTGVTIDSQINNSPKDLASRDAIDKAAPNPKLCTQFGASAMAFDQRVFVSFNPFNVYVAQADVKPACVLRTANVVPMLQDKGLIDRKEVTACKEKMNTWAFVGDLGDYPQLSCVYQSKDAQNEFLSSPKYGIGEDVYDNDRDAVIDAVRKRNLGKGFTKQIKDGFTDGEKEKLAKKAAALNMGKEIENVDKNFFKDSTTY